MIALLSARADPHELPEEMWEDYVNSPARLHCTLVDESYCSSQPHNPLRWCTMEIWDALGRILDPMQEYSLWKATKFLRPSTGRKRLVEVTATTALSIILCYIKG